MGYIPSVQYSPLYLAVERGYFAEEGLSLDFDYSFETDGVALVASDELQFSLASGEQVLLARAQGLPVVYVLAWWQDYPVGIVATAESGIRQPADLQGMHVGVPILGGASYIGYRALLRGAGLSQDIATLDVIGFTQVEALAAGTVDAAVIYVNNEPIQLESRGIDVEVMRVADYAHLASNGLITNEKTMQTRPDLVRSMISATLRGIEDAIAEPDAAFEASTRFVEALKGETATVQRKVLEASIEFWRTDRPGYSDGSSWSTMQDVLLDMGLLTAPLDLTKAYSNDFLP
jgi:NitT/TauT family transport system substrate-binding protein